MRVLKFLSRLLICILCVFSICSASFAAGNVPDGDVGEYGNWFTEENKDKYNSAVSSDMEKFQNGFQSQIQSSEHVPIEVKLGLSFMQALSSIDSILQISLVRFTIIFLFIMYALWVALEAYKMIRDSSDYKTVLYDIFKKGFTIAIWVLILDYGPIKLFTMIMDPIIALGTYISDFILTAVAKTYNITIPDTCAAIHNYVHANSTTTNANGTVQMLTSPETAANIMCMPARISTYFYKATGAAWKWMLHGFGHSATEIVAGAICVVLFIKCIFRYAFMTLGVVADLFLTLMMLPFTALAESMPSTNEKGYVGQIFSGFLKIFNTKKLSEVLGVFINTALYFISLAIVIAICAALLSNIINFQDANEYTVGRAMITILCAGLILYLAGQTEKIIEQIGGSIDNSFGETLMNDTKNLWGKGKNFAGKVYKDWLKKK